MTHGMEIFLEDTLKIKYMYSFIDEIIKDLERVDNQFITAEELAQDLIIKLKQSIKYEIVLVSLSTVNLN